MADRIDTGKLFGLHQGSWVLEVCLMFQSQSKGISTIIDEQTTTSWCHSECSICSTILAVVISDTPMLGDRMLKSEVSIY